MEETLIGLIDTENDFIVIKSINNAQYSNKAGREDGRR